MLYKELTKPMNQETNDILIVDDDPDILNACATMLRMRLYNIDTARNGYEAKQRLLERKYKIVLTDLKMPNISGMDILKDVKEKSPETDVILFTAHGSINEAVEAMKLGAYDFIIKPIDINHMAIIVKRCIEKNSLIAQIGGLKEIINLYESSKAIVSETDMQKLLGIIVKLAVETLRADAGALMLYDPDEKNLEIKAAAGLQEKQIIGKKIAIDERAVNRAGKTEQRTLQGSLDPRFKDIIPYCHVESSMSIPLIGKEDLLGVLTVSRITDQKPFTEEHAKLVSIFASQISIALENSRLFEKVLEEKEAISHMFMGIRDGAVLLDKNLHITLINGSALKLLNTHNEACLSSSIETVTRTLQISRPWDTLRSSTEIIEVFEMTPYDSQSVFFEIHAMKLGHEHSGWLLIIRDLQSNKTAKI